MGNPTGSIGAFVVVFSEDRAGVLLVQHSYNRNQWSLPGGSQEVGEHLVQTGKREFIEETGLECEISARTLVGMFSLRKSLGVVALFVGEIVGGEQNGATDEVIRSKFVSFAEIDSYDIYPAQRAFIERARSWKLGDPLIFDLP
jgi:8-oxo-dGTP pyrophosphatase MutT (NUDIX family)